MLNVCFVPPVDAKGINERKGEKEGRIPRIERCDRCSLIDWKRGRERETQNAADSLGEVIPSHGLDSADFPRIPGMHRCAFADRASMVVTEGENELSMPIETIAFPLSSDFWPPGWIHIHPVSPPRILGSSLFVLFLNIIFTFPYMRGHFASLCFLQYLRRTL